MTGCLFPPPVCRMVGELGHPSRASQHCLLRCSISSVALHDSVMAGNARLWGVCDRHCFSHMAAWSRARHLLWQRCLASILTSSCLSCKDSWMLRSKQTAASKLYGKKFHSKLADRFCVLNRECDHSRPAQSPFPNLDGLDELPGALWPPLAIKE